MSRDILVPDRIELNQGEINRYLSLVWDQFSQINQGRTANTGTVTLTDNVATTVVDHIGFEDTMGVYFSPLTANASAEVGAGTIYISAKTENQFTITHANNAQTDRDFDYVVVG